MGWTPPPMQARMELGGMPEAELLMSVKEQGGNGQDTSPIKEGHSSSPKQAGKANPVGLNRQWIGSIAQETGRESGLASTLISRTYHQQKGSLYLDPEPKVMSSWCMLSTLQSKKLIPDMPTRLQCFTINVVVVAQKQPTRVPDVMEYQSAIGNSKKYKWPS